MATLRTRYPDAPAIAPGQIRGLRRSDYEALFAAGRLEDQRIELLAGQIRELPLQGVSHAFLVTRLGAFVMRLTPPAFEVGIQTTYPLSDDSMPEPDIVVSPMRTTMDYQRNAVLLIEVSTSSLAYDLGEKAREYAHAGVPEYWVVDTEALQITVHREPHGAAYTSVHVVDKASPVGCIAVPEIALRLLDILPE